MTRWSRTYPEHESCYRKRQRPSHLPGHNSGETRTLSNLLTLAAAGVGWTLRVGRSRERMSANLWYDSSL